MTVPVKLRPIPLCTETGWTHDALVKKKASMPHSSFNRGWHLIAASDEDLTFPAFRSCFTPGVALGPIQRNDWATFTGVDLAGEKRPGNAIVTLKVHPVTHRRIPIDLRAGSWKSNETVQHLADIYEAYRPTVIMVENNGYQQALVDWIQALKLDFWPIVEPTTTTGSTKYNETIGLPGLQVEFQNRAWTIPSDEFEAHPPGHMSKGCQWCRWVYEMTTHPLAVSSDYVMATWFARQGVEQHGYVFDSDDLPENLSAR